MRNLFILTAFLGGCGCWWTGDCINGTDDTDPQDCSDAPPLGVQPTFDDAAAVYGWVTSPSGNVEVVAALVDTEVDGEPVSTLSDPRGCFRVELPEGEHTLSVTVGERYATSVTFDVQPGRDVDLGAVALDPRGARLAVVHGQFDEVGALLGHLGLPFDRYLTAGALYDDASLLQDYDVVFAACGSDVTTSGAKEFTEAQKDNVRAFVDAGGTLYVSDWEWELVEAAAPEALHFRADPNVGPQGNVTATMLDRELVQLVGPTTSIHFALPLWAVIDEVDQATALVEANIPGEGVRPLAARHFRGDEGRIFYTSFHNEDQASEDMQAVLLRLILTL